MKIPSATDSQRLDWRAKQLHNRITVEIAKMDLTDDDARDHLMKLVRKHRAQCKAEGIDFPELTVVLLPVKGVVHLARKDLDPASVQQTIRNLVIEHAPIFKPELAEAITLAWPGYARAISQVVAENKAPRLALVTQ